MSYEYLALLAAACWATGSLLSAPAAVHLGAFSFTRWRMFLAATVLWSMVLFTGSWQTLDPANAGLLALSGLIGIFVGDTALFASMNRLGPRRAGVLFATHSLFSVVLAWFWLGETLWGFTLIGSSMLISGVMIAVFFGKRNSEQHQWESNQGNLTAGVILGLLAALCQAVATLMLKPLMETDIDAIAASAVRMTAAFTAHFCLLAAGLKVARSYQPVNKRIFTLVLVNTLLSMVLGMTLILQALKYGDAGMVAVLSSVSPVIILPLLWVVYKKSPAAGAWAGALLTVTGTVLILLS